jgi:hypothetical protein
MPSHAVRASGASRGPGSRGPACPPLLPLLLGVAVLTGGLAILWEDHAASAGDGPLAGDVAVVAGSTGVTGHGPTSDGPAPPDETGPGETGAVDPAAVRIGALDVAADLIPLGTTEDGRLEVPEDAAVAGWWAGGARPGEPGAAVVVAHVDSVDGPGAFFGLWELDEGDRVDIDRADGHRLRWEVQRVEEHPKDEFPTDAVYGHTDEPTLRLVTCSGHFDPHTRSYDANTVVFLRLADADGTAPDAVAAHHDAGVTPTAPDSAKPPRR